MTTATFRLLVPAMLLSMAPSQLRAASLFQTPDDICATGFNRICYGIDGGTAQNISMRDLEFQNGYLRWWVDTVENVWQDGPAYMWSRWRDPLIYPGATCVVNDMDNDGMPPTAVVIDTKSHDGEMKILYRDLAHAMDGGEHATEEERAASLWGCGTNGGQIGVKVDLTRPEYNTEDYKKWKYHPDGVIIQTKPPPS